MTDVSPHGHIIAETDNRDNFLLALTKEEFTKLEAHIEAHFTAATAVADPSVAQLGVIDVAKPKVVSLDESLQDLFESMDDNTETSVDTSVIATTTNSTPQQQSFFSDPFDALN